MNTKYLILGNSSAGLSINFTTTAFVVSHSIEVVEAQLKQLGYSVNLLSDCLKNFDYDTYYSTLPESTKTKLIVKGFLTRRRKGIVKGQFKF